MLKPALARGELQCVGASTLNEYRKYIEKDGALERRFQTVIVDPPSVDETIEILKGLRKKYEDHHRVTIPDATLVVGGQALRALHHRPVPARQGDRRDRRGGRARAARVAGAAAGGRRAQGRAREGERARRKPRSATRTSSAPRRCATRSASCRARSGASRRSGRSDRQTRRPVLGEEEIAFIVSPLDRHPGHAAAGGGDGAAAAHGRRAARVGGRPGRGDQGDRRARSAAPAPGSRIPSGRSARSSSPAPPASARPSWPARWRSSCSPTRPR